jgi:hypothetical protein
MVSTGWLNKETGAAGPHAVLFKREGKVLLCATSDASWMPSAMLFDQEVFDKF